MAEELFDTAFGIIAALVKDFQASEAHHLSPAYSEAQVRKDYLDKFWTAFGWDVNHVTQRNPYEQEVKVELSQRHGNYNKHADYAFSLAPNFRDTLYIVEAKKPAKNLRDADCCYQAVRYGYNAGNPFVILHDFEQLLVLNSTRKANVETATAQILAEWHYTQLLDKEQFARIFYWFSRESVAKGALPQRAGELIKLKGKATSQGKHFKTDYRTVDEDFLADLEGQRENLAKAFKKTSPQLNGEALTAITQRVLDRLIFMRFLEDRGIENKSHIEEVIQSSNPWKTFAARVVALDRIYNGIVFKALALLDEGRQPFWKALRDRIQRYIFYPEARWAPSMEMLSRLERVRDKFEPTDLIELIAPVFGTGFGMFGSRDLPWEEQEKLRQQNRADGIKQILGGGGLNGVLKLADKVSDSWGVGITLAEVSGEQFLPQIVPTGLIALDEKRKQFATGYLAWLINANGREWAESKVSSDWTPDETAAFADCMPFKPDTWTFIKALGTEQNAAYWRRVRPHAIRQPPIEVEQAARLLIEAQRGPSAISLLASSTYSKNVPEVHALFDLFELALNTPIDKDERVKDPHEFHAILEVIYAAKDIDDIPWANFQSWGA